MLNKFLAASALGTIIILGFAGAAQAQANVDASCQDGSADDALQCGTGAEASGDDSTAIGNNAQASADYATAIGESADASGISATALGDSASASGAYSVALGDGAEASADYAVAVGEAAIASGLAATALGNASEAAGADSIVLGANSTASYDNSVAIGTGVTTQFANQFLMGTTAHIYTMPGITSDASRAAQTGDLELVTTDANGNLASDGGAFGDRLSAAESALSDAEDAIADAEAILSTPGRVIDGDEVTAAINDNAKAINTVSSTASRNQDRVASAESAISDNSRSVQLLNTQFETMGLQVDELARIVSDNTEQIDANIAGIAIANAMAGASWLQANETNAITANWGYYDNTNAFAISATQRIDKNWSANMGIGLSPDEGKVGARAGVRLGW